MNNPENDKGGGVQVISRVAAILRSLGDEPAGLSLGAIAKKSELPRSTVQRLVDALASEGLLEVRGRGGVCLGPAFMKLASHSHVDITQIARSFIETLSQATGETAMLVSANSSELIILHSAVSSQELRVTPVAGMLLSIHATSSGKMLLSRLEDDDVIKLVGPKLKSLTPNTADLPKLLKQLEQIRSEGFAYDYEEHTQGVCSFAIGLQTPQGRYAIELVGPSWRMNEAIDQIRQALLRCKEDLLSAMRTID